MSLTVPQRYTTPAILLHWAIALLIAANLLLGWTFPVHNPPRFNIDLHKSFGLTVLGLWVLRVLWRATHTPPPMPPYAAWERRAAHWTHGLLYALIFLVPFSGWLHDSAWNGAASHPLKLYWVIPWFRIGALQNLDPASKDYWHGILFQVHSALAYVLTAAFALHVAGALKHQFLERKPELQRMWPGKGR